MSVAVVTGARGGIGSATVARLRARRGLDVHGVDVDDAFPELDRLDALVCAHGISGRRLGDGPVDTCTEEGWDAVLDANLKSVFLYAKRAIPLLRANGGGAIVTVSSALGLVGGDGDFADARVRRVEGGPDRPDERDGGHVRARRDPLQRRRAGADRDADERARAVGSRDPRAPRRPAAADRDVRRRRRTSRRRASTSRPRRSSPARC